MITSNKITSNVKSALSKTLHIYCRVSTEAQVEHGHSMEAQEKIGIAKASNLGMSYSLHLEKGKSAATDNIEKRPVLSALLDMCELGEVTDIFVTEIDRLTRSTLVMYYLKQILIKNGIILHTVSQAIDLRDSDDEFMSDIIALIAKRENTTRAIRSKRGLKEAAEKGKWIGVVLPYGYRKKADGIVEIDPEEVKVYKQIIDFCLAGNGTNTIAKKLNALEIPTRCRKALPKGTKVRNKYTDTIRIVRNEDFVWRPGTLYSILTNPMYKGERRYKGQIIKSPACIDSNTWTIVQEQLKRNKNHSENHTQKHFYLLKGFLRCGRCGSNLYGRIKTDERTYMCSSKRSISCGLRSVNLDKLNTWIWEVITDNESQLKILREELFSKDTETQLSFLRNKIKSIQKQISELSTRKEKLIVLFEKEKISMEEFDMRSFSLQHEKAQLIQALKAVENEFAIINDQISHIDKYTKDADILKLINLWSDQEKREFALKKIKNIVINWNELLWEHFIEITFEAGFCVTEPVFIKSSNPPIKKGNTPLKDSNYIKNFDELINFTENRVITSRTIELSMEIAIKQNNYEIIKSKVLF